MDWKDVGKAVSPAYAASGFFGDMFSGKKGIAAANAGADAAAQYTNKAYGDARVSYNKGYEESDGILSGYEQPGRQAYGSYADAIGVNGADGYGRAKASFDADPFAAGEQAYADQQTNRLFRKYNANGDGNSGASRAAVALAGATRYGERVADYKNRLMGLGQTGAQFGQQRAQNAMTRGNEMATYDINQNIGLGNNEVQRYGNINKAQNEGVNNLFKAVGAATKAATMFV